LNPGLSKICWDDAKANIIPVIPQGHLNFKLNDRLFLKPNFIRANGQELMNASFYLGYETMQLKMLLQNYEIVKQWRYKNLKMLSSIIIKLLG
jgi:hypothetical protein